MSQPLRMPLWALAPCIRPCGLSLRPVMQRAIPNQLVSNSQSHRPYSHTSPPSRPVLLYTNSLAPTAPGQPQVRLASSSPSQSASSQAAPSQSTTVLTWNDFFKLRQRRRYFNLVSSIGTASSSLFVGISYLSAQGADMLAFTGLDPLVSLPLTSFACGVSGWLVGPAIGSALFRLTNRGASEMNTKERNFYARIKKYRIDPSSSSMQNPVPDYYGEKITSVQGYRQWLKDQRAFNKKRQSFL